MHNNSPKEIYEILKNSKRPICCMDSRFDFDALCSPLALREALKKEFDTDLTITNIDSLSRRTREVTQGIFDISPVHENTPPETIDFSEHDLLIVIDSGQLSHISTDDNFQLKSDIKILNIDHHESNPYYGHYNYVKIYGAACTVLYELLKEMGIKVDFEMAKYLLLGIITDNGFFQYNSTGAIDLRTSAELMDMGVNMYDYVWRLTFNEDFEDMKLMGLVYSNLKIDHKNRTAYSTLLLKDINDRGIKLKETVYATADLIKKLKDVNYVFTVEEVSEGEDLFNISLRSHYKQIDVSKIAVALGGGGHKMASGVNIPAKTAEEAIAKIIETAENLGLNTPIPESSL
ncbi:hypothetical protein A2619_02420 [candidate division WWE3 bacterium RIFOXYD1_FULL_39_9]|nr:MAG: hypothetical protein A2619_02420 [candidate division WWE3 bacterium RIFOXYD1_FULL_39_9]